MAQMGEMKMFYRLENERDYLSIKHVATDREVGWLLEGEFVDRNQHVSHGFRFFNNAGEELTTVTERTAKCPLRVAAMFAARHQEHYGFPDLKDATWDEHNDRVERRLGTCLADAAIAFSRGFCEATNGGLTAKTSDEFAAALAELSSIWWVSRFGCFEVVDKYCGMEQPYFANPQTPGPRLTFSGAAQVYGMRELRERRPSLTDAERQKALNWVLQWLSDALSNELDHQKRDDAEWKLQRATQTDMSLFNLTMEWRRRQAEHLQCLEG